MDWSEVGKKWGLCFFMPPVIFYSFFLPGWFNLPKENFLGGFLAILTYIVLIKTKLFGLV